MKQATLSPDDAAAHMYPSDLKKFEFGEHVAEAFSIAVGCPDETSVPLFTTDQAEAYAAARVREALEQAARTAVSHPNPYIHCQQSEHACDMTAVAIGKAIRDMIPK